jgi:hypothetical protein
LPARPSACACSRISRKSSGFSVARRGRLDGSGVLLGREVGADHVRRQRGVLRRGAARFVERRDRLVVLSELLVREPDGGKQIATSNPVSRGDLPRLRATTGDSSSTTACHWFRSPSASASE